MTNKFYFIKVIIGIFKGKTHTSLWELGFWSNSDQTSRLKSAYKCTYSSHLYRGSHVDNGSWTHNLAGNGESRYILGWG